MFEVDFDNILLFFKYQKGNDAKNKQKSLSVINKY